MKAIVQDRYGSAEVFRLTDIEPPQPGVGEVLVRVRAAGVDPGVWHLMTGRPYLIRVMGFGLRRPKSRVPGGDVAGVVEAVGRGVTGFRPGDEVFGTGEGSFAEFAVARADRLAPKPADVGFEQAAAVPTSGFAALQGLRDRQPVLDGKKVLIIGAGGGVGTFAVQLAKAFGAEVTGLCSSSKVDLVRSLGADHVIDYTREELTGPPRFDHILDTAGNRPLSLLRRVLKPDGTLVIVGAEGGGNWFGHTGRLLSVPLVSLFVKQRLGGIISVPRPADLESLRELLAAGRLTPVVDRTYPLAEAAEAVRHIERGHTAGKVVISVDSL
ncbi:NAD(P)-dependent alcohol dehydrogenase [Allorhizocola rhizosphaerae]|uniref:NAD(P)-dependent alcohol dehydrogenase n=1 Tax=Allorhizocola rhizosphaerae TaxID=1872709 RepID=UPI000E3D0669|nr:NAD(P)-dependent alcohol dehydrogenase [Allorhizocola rhizosphaerae]